MFLREKEKVERNRRAGRGKEKKHKWTKNQEITVLAGVVVAIGIAVAVYQNQRGSNGGVFQKAGEQWRKASGGGLAGEDLARRCGIFIWIFRGIEYIPQRGHTHHLLL